MPRLGPGRSRWRCSAQQPCFRSHGARTGPLLPPQLAGSAGVRWSMPIDLPHRTGVVSTACDVACVGLAWTYVIAGTQGRRVGAADQDRAEEELHIESWPTVACALAGLEPMCADADEYETVQHQIMAAREEEPLPLVQWRLTPAKPDARFEDDERRAQTRFLGETWFVSLDVARSIWRLFLPGRGRRAHHLRRQLSRPLAQQLCCAAHDENR